MLIAALTAVTLFYIAVFARGLHAQPSPPRPTAIEIAIGAITNFFDTLGIGSFATTTAIFQFTRMVPDALIPGTLNAGHTLPTIFQAFIYISVIEVDTLTLTLMIAGATIGAWFGAGWVAHLPLRQVRFGVGFALAVAFIAMLMRQLAWFPAGGAALGLTGTNLVLAVLINGVLGAISTLGIGFYAPCMTLVSLLGMNPAAAFPIMMGSSAFLMPAASSRFVRANSYAPRVAVGLTLGGLIGVPIAAFIVKSLPLDALRWLVMAVVLYATQSILRAAWAER